LQASSEQVAFMKQKVEELSKKASLSVVPELSISKSERVANINVFQRHISVGENVLSLWQEGKFDGADVEATIAHEIGHLMDFRNSYSKSFRNLLVESLWIGLGVVPLVVYLFSPSIVLLAVAVLLTLGWGFSLPWVIRRAEISIELEADRNAALYLVEPKQLANALTKISSFDLPGTKFSFTAKLSFLAGTLTHPTLNERLQSLQKLPSKNCKQNQASL
jgi:Zn-dependent protease with chaperone function